MNNGSLLSLICGFVVAFMFFMDMHARKMEQQAEQAPTAWMRTADRPLEERIAAAAAADMAVQNSQQSALSVPRVAVSAPVDRLVLNNAPVLQGDAQACREPLFWGNAQAAGWTVCADNLPAAGCTVYSFGLGADWTFDSAAASSTFKCQVHGFDPSDQNWREGMHGQDYAGINYSQQYPGPGKTFHNWGLGSAARAVYPANAAPTEWPGLGDPALSKTNSASWEMRSVQQTMADLGHSAVTVLKIDVEGSEWIAVSSMLSTMEPELSRGVVSQLLMEWHWDPHSTLRNQRNRAILQKIEKIGFVPWKVNRHVGSDCCLDVSYLWVGKK